jgi:hypothetical protein
MVVAGEKSGFYVGHTESIVTVSLAGHNAVRGRVKKAGLENIFNKVLVK